MDSKKTASALEHVAAEFINRESNRTSLITVTRAELDTRGTHANIFVSVYPDTQSAAALDFLSRSRGEFADYVRKHLKIRAIPHIEFLHDPNIGGLEKL